ncbi:DUF2783 domain-containing protein [Pseudomaricurvus alkylphenolicus]|jgi:hypothetical protein|uniref:DUF2783 domain-containing protein n=1 Tax=Pseudomaricurvus alkylphenolicus TaxID=1306991 RepID=UPI0014223168|nr:DUF2783 domain-containing protein [Pseudomaricurvus alkylphenolicus]NIB40999.1 DUF2783 domain-containing protein [Pseudomaricurvus alkylphenolicus]
MHLNTEANLNDADAFYAELTDLHRDLQTADSERVNARLILLLANHIGDNRILSEAMAIAKDLDPVQN